MFIFCFAKFQEIARRTTARSHGLCSSTRHKQLHCFRQSRARRSKREARVGPTKAKPGSSHDPPTPQWPTVLDTPRARLDFIVRSNPVAALNLRYFFFFASGELFDFLGFSVGQFFELFEGTFVLVLADFLVFFELVDGFFDVA